MQLYIYKGPKPNLLTETDGLFIPAFKFPQSVSYLVEHDTKPYIYVYKSEPTKRISIMNNITKCITLDDVSDTQPKDDLKCAMKTLKFWQMISYF